MIRAEHISHFVAKRSILDANVEDANSVVSDFPVPIRTSVPKVISYRNSFLLIQVIIHEWTVRPYLDLWTSSKNLVEAFYACRLSLLSGKPIYAALAEMDRTADVTYDHVMASRQDFRMRLEFRETDLQSLHSIMRGGYSPKNLRLTNRLQPGVFPSDRLVRYVCNAIRQHRLEDEEILRQAHLEGSSNAQFARSSSDALDNETSSDMQTARQLIKTSINRLLVTIGDSLESSREEIKFLTRDRKFLPQVSRAILMRIPVNPDEITPFLYYLCSELNEVAHGGEYGNDSGRLLIRDEEMAVGRSVDSGNRFNQERTNTNWMRATVRGRQK